MTSVTYMLESPWLVAYKKSTAIAVAQMGSWEWVHYYINPLICIVYSIHIYIYMGSVRFPGPPDLGVW